MALNGFNIFTSFLFLQLFYALAMTLIVPAIPSQYTLPVNMFNNPDAQIDYQNVATSLQGGITDQTNIPVLDFGSLVFYASSIILSFMINFVTAVPQMLILLLTAFFFVFPIGITIQANMITALTILLTILYWLAVIAFVTNIRTGVTGGGLG